MQTSLISFINNDKIGLTITHLKNMKVKEIEDIKLNRKLRDLGFHFLGSGVSRQVYGNSEFVIKIEKHGIQWGRRWLEQNKNEIRNWEDMNEEQRECVAKIIAYDKENHWIIQERCDVDDDEENEDIEASVEELRNKMDELGIGELDGDLCGANSGVTKEGNYVCIDYGFLSIREERKKEI